MENNLTKSTLLEKAKVETIGAYINFDEFRNYTRSFNQIFPYDVSKVKISRKAQEFILSQDESKVSGIRFLFGLENQNDPNSFWLFLVPCEQSTLKGDRHNNIYLP